MIGVVGDYNPANKSHIATNEALGSLSHGTPFEWIGTDDPALRARARELKGIFIAPASPYRNMDATLDVIRDARELGLPLVGT